MLEVGPGGVSRRSLGEPSVGDDLFVRVLPVVFSGIGLVLLLIYLVARPSGGHTPPGFLPTVSHPATMIANGALAVEVRCNGRVFVDGDWVPDDLLASMLAESRASKGAPVFVSADSSCEFAQLVKVMRTLREGGRHHLFLVTATSR